jgi:predicted N-acetyltransferase YhbS
MITIREYHESDAVPVGILIADTYGAFNLSHASPEEQKAFLGPFQHARSTEKAHREAIAEVIHAAMVFVAEKDGEVVGVLRGKTEKLQSLFVSGAHHRQGIGRMLVERFEENCVRQGAKTIRLMSTPYAIPFYQAVGYKKTTGLRKMNIFEGRGFVYQPMKKVVK